jgi:hypothetical protein
MYRQCFLIATTLVFSVLNMSSAQESKLYTPQPEHELFKRFAGEWQFEKKSAPGDGSTPQKLGSGEMKAELLGGFFVVCRWSGDVYETDFNAVQTLGYDVDKEEYSGSWVDSIMSYRWQFNGSLEAKGNELVIAASGPGPNGGTTKFRERYQFNSADSITVVAQMLQDEKWVTFMTTQLTRKKKKKSD